MIIRKPLAGLALGLGLALSPVAALAASTALTATLAGANETPPGDADGTGSFSVDLDADAGDFCYTLKVAKIGAATAAHVHTGVAGTSGAPVIPLQVGEDICVAAEPSLLKEIVAKPESYYVNVHNAEFPAGAVRGQLAVKK